MGSRTLCRALYVDNDNLPSDVRVGKEVTMWQIPGTQPHNPQFTTMRHLATQSTIHKYEAPGSTICEYEAEPYHILQRF